MRGQNPQRNGRVPGAKAPVPSGIAFAWTASVNQKSIGVFYRGKPYTLVQETFGVPVQKTNTPGQPGIFFWWVYTGLNITDAQGTKYGTAQFGFVKGMVQQVRILK